MRLLSQGGITEQKASEHLDGLTICIVPGGVRSGRPEQPRGSGRSGRGEKILMKVMDE